MTTLKDLMTLSYKEIKELQVHYPVDHREVELCVNNDGELYKGLKGVWKGAKKAKTDGEYDHTKALKAIQRVVDGNSKRIFGARMCDLLDANDRVKIYNDLLEIVIEDIEIDL